MEDSSLGNTSRTGKNRPPYRSSTPPRKSSSYRKPSDDSRPRDREVEQRHSGPALAEDILFTDLDPEVRTQLRVLPKEVAERVGRHLVAAGRLLDHDPGLALQHAQAARVKAPRFGVVREAVGEAAYHTGDWHMALMELRAARRVTGNEAYLPMIIDCERALGRIGKARQLLDEARKDKLDIATRVELAILSAGIHRENGDTAAAIADVSLPELRNPGEHGWLARLRYCYAELLLERDQVDEAKTWFGLAADADNTDETDAADRLLELEGVALGEDTDAVTDSDNAPSARIDPVESAPGAASA
ncbi:MAG: hypothetical protein ACRDQZ_18795 [Mycobacteriales bacterium]